MLLLATLLALAPSFQETQGSDPAPWRVVGGQSDPITAVAASSDGKVLVTASAGAFESVDAVKGEVLWSAARTSKLGGPELLSVGEELIAFCEPRMVAPNLLRLESGARRNDVVAPMIAEVTALVITPDDTWVWYGNVDGQVGRMTPGDAKGWSRRSLGNGGVTALALGGKLLAAAGKDGTIRFVGSKSANVDDKKVWEDVGDVVVLCLDGKDKTLASGSSTGELKLWKVANGKVAHALEGHGHAITALAMDPKGKWLASGDAAGKVFVWDLKKGARLLELDAGDGARVSGLAFAGKGETLATAASDERLVLWDVSGI